MKKTILSTCLSTVILSSLFADTTFEDVVVTAKSNSQVIDTAGSFSIITQEDIKSSNAFSLQNILEESVGISISSNDRSINGRKNITLRGMNPEHTAILINGKRISNTDAQIGHSDFQYNWIPLSAISKIEIVRGPMSSLYGSKALGGVVNIITKKTNKKFEGNLDLKYSRLEGTSQGQGKSASVNLSGKVTDKLSLSIFAEKKVLSSVDNKEGKIDSEKLYKPSAFEGKDITNAMLNSWYVIDDTQDISASILYGKESREAYSMNLFETLKRRGQETNTYFDKLYDIDKIHYSLEYNKYFDDITLNLKSYTTKTDVHADSFKYTHKLKDDVLSAEVTFENFTDNYIILGTDFRKESYEKDIDNNQDILGRKDFENDISYKSLYFQDELNLNDNLLLTFGARYDKHEKFGGQFSPKVYAVYKLNENQRLKGGYGRGFNAPTLTQLSDDYSFSNPSAGHAFKGNSKLNPEISDTYELAYEYNTLKNIFRTTLFYTKVKDLIAPKESNIPAGAGLYYEVYSNINSTQMKGVELEFEKKDLLSNLDFNFFYNFLNTKDKEKNRELNFKPKHKVNTSLKYHFDDTFNTTLSFAYTGEQKNYDDINRKYTKMDGYLTSKIQFSKDFTKNLNVRTGVDNITNKQLADEFNYQLKERTYYISLNYKF